MKLRHLIGAIALGTIACQPAHAHDAPSGWSYPFECGSGYDCRPEPRVRETGDGYVVPSGEALAASDARIKVSPDGEYHWCSQGGREDGRTICLFVPARMF